MECAVLIDGSLVPVERASVSVFDRGFMYGDSVFESLRTYGGVPFALDRHLERLQRSAARVALRLPVTLTELREEVERGLAALGADESYVRLTVTRGIGRGLGLDPTLADAPLRVILVTPFAQPAPELYERGTTAICFRSERPSDAAGVADAKIGNYLLGVLAMARAREQGAQEALIEDAHGHLLEGATSNFFVVMGERLVTAPETAAILPGITRARVLELARSRGLRVELRAIRKLELPSFEEAFVCSSLRELVPVVRIDGHPVGSGVPGPVTRDLLLAFRQLARA